MKNECQLTNLQLTYVYKLDKTSHKNDATLFSFHPNEPPL